MTGALTRLAERGVISPLDLTLAEALGLPLTVFPSHHSGFLGGEFGQTGEPEAFAARLHEVLDQA